MSMSTSAVLDEVQTNTTVRAQITSADRLRAETTAVRLQVRWPGVRKTLSEPQKRRAADAFDADLKSLSAAKKLIDTGHPAFRAVSTVRSQAVAYWRGITLPYIEAGVRLIRREDVPGFDVQMMTVKAELVDAVQRLDRCYGELVDQARERLGDLFDPGDYPDSLSGLFDISWDYPSTTPPEYLRAVSPQLYEAECQRVQARFDEAVRLAETAFAEELSELVTHLSERLMGQDDGKPKVFRDSAITNLLEFFERFQRLNIRSNEQLDQLVDRARRVVRGVDAQSLRDQPNLRDRVVQGLSRVESTLGDWMTDRPRRSIIRRPR
jgi:hypothetical protein